MAVEDNADTAGTPPVEVSEPAGTPPADKAEAPKDADGAEKSAETPSETADDADKADEPWTKLEAQYKGDRNRIAQRYREVTTQNAKFAARLKALESENEKLKTGTPPRDEPTRPEPGPKPAAAPEAPPDLKAIDDDITALKNQRDAIPAPYNALYDEVQTLTKEIVILEYEVKKADDLDKKAAEANLRAAKADLGFKTTRLQQMWDKHALLDEKVAAKGRERQETERALVERARQLQAQQARNAQISAEFPTEVEGLAESYFVDAAQIDGDLTEHQKTAVHNYVKHGLMAFLLQPENRSVDISETGYEEEARRLAEEFARAHEDSGKSAALKMSKRVPASPVRPAPRTTSTGTPSPNAHDDLTPNQIAARKRLADRGVGF